ncbi:hypothetical protein [Acinetobacter lwoffii]|uniref:hypothetical protein n=1 Tax=Acinetobacter lwoffii TaxID=28090 RepID=UPI003D6BAE69
MTDAELCRDIFNDLSAHTYMEFFRNVDGMSNIDKRKSEMLEDLFDAGFIERKILKGLGRNAVEIWHINLTNSGLNLLARTKEK